MHGFKFDIQAEVFSKASPDGQERRIGGIVSTDSLDKQSETLLQDGLDFQPFLKGGWFNDNHDPSTDAVIGYPTTAELRVLPNGQKGWYVEGYLLKGHRRADTIWDLANALQKTDRRLGFSVEGKILERDPNSPKTVRKAVVNEVAITRCPVNGDTSLQVLAKALTAGAAVADPGVSPGEGFALRKESVEADTEEDEEEDEKKRKRKKMTKSEAIAYLRSLNPGLSPQFAEEIVEYAKRWYPAA